MAQIKTTIPVLKALENLGALSNNLGLYKIKPFRDWIGSEWSNRIFTFRLCNAGESLDILKSGDNLVAEAKNQYRKFELLSRAIWSIDDKSLVSEEDVVKYNEQHHTDLTVHDFLVNWMHNLEGVVIDRLDSVYGGLQIKQIRLLQGVVVCAECGKVYQEIPKGSVTLEYALAEIICAACLPTTDKSLYDIIEDHLQDPSPTPTPSPDKEVKKEINSSHKCNCGKEFETLEIYTTHIQDCPEYKDA